ncbi:virulence plasmid protein pGP3-D [Chlamydia ibidis]|uniref:Virulence plasmid protein pGP3-D n=1 Tax=Chlamydia ibidis TaxID=1405396 RepID=S7KH28_9CHLA|nr:virulence factor Pgp3 [Chlamydia ibidis]EPP35491.1 virulence plasmid protein pGP3-D [Chlamydia ibidis]
MGNSGFYLNNQQNCVFADNIKLGQMTSPLGKDQLILGTDNTPTIATIQGSEGIKVTITPPAQVEKTGGQPTTINLSVDSEKISETVLGQIGKDLIDGVVDQITDSLKQQIIQEIISNQELGISKAFKSYSIQDSIRCDGLFTKQNINTIYGGTEIGLFTITPDNTNSMILVNADIIASRMEGTVVLALVKNGDTAPCAISYGYSSGSPNVCTLKTAIPTIGKQPLTFSLRVGGMDSGVVWINALANGDKILGMPATSNVSFLEVKPQTNG